MTPVPFFEYTLYEMFHYFLVWSVIGWIIEIIDMTVETGAYQNRGFLNMPLCPIYGVGVLLIIAIFRPFNGTFLPIFIGSSILCTGFELAVGLLLEAIFHMRWWDYSHMLFNYKGLICLRNSLFWGVGCVVMINVVQPTIEKIVAMMPVNVGLAIIVIMSVLIIIDLIASIMAANELNDRLQRLDAISNKMLALAQKIGGVLSDRTLDLMDMGENVKQKIMILKEEHSEMGEEFDNEYNALKNEYDKLVGGNFLGNRLIKAFPTLKTLKYESPLRILKRRLSPDSAEHFELKLDEVKKYRERHRK